MGYYSYPPTYSGISCIRPYFHVYPLLYLTLAPVSTILDSPFDPASPILHLPLCPAFPYRTRTLPQYPLSKVALTPHRLLQLLLDDPEVMEAGQGRRYGVLLHPSPTRELVKVVAGVHGGVDAVGDVGGCGENQRS